jgi:DNA/RNA endonuclease YhcR with UshA esterase domain
MFKSRKQLISCPVAASLVAGFAALIVVVAAGQTGRTRTSTAPSNIITIAAARALPPGTVVTVEGSVSVSSGVLGASRYDAGFAIQDQSGGIFVRTNVDADLRGGKRVRVRGQLVGESGQLILVPVHTRDVKVLGKGLGVRAEPVSTGHINEATEGRLVRVTGTITKPIVNELPRGHRVFIDDGSGEVQVYVFASTTFPVRRLQPGQRISVTGFSGQYEDRYEVVPRARSDIRLN